METHIKALGILQIIHGVFWLAIGIAGFLFFGGIGAIVGMTERSSEAMVAVPILGALGLIALFLFAVLAVPGIIAGYGLLNYRSWARILTIVLCCLELLNFPVGTALGIYGLWVLLSPQGIALFQREQFRHY